MSKLLKIILLYLWYYYLVATLLTLHQMNFLLKAVQYTVDYKHNVHNKKIFKEASNVKCAYSSKNYICYRQKRRDGEFSAHAQESRVSKWNRSPRGAREIQHDFPHFSFCLLPSLSHPSQKIDRLLIAVRVWQCSMYIFMKAAPYVCKCTCTVYACTHKINKK